METRKFTDSVQKFQQQLQSYKDISSKRLQDIEDLIGLVAQKMEILQKEKLQKKGVAALVDPFVKLIKEETEAEKPLYDEEGSEDFDCELQLADFGIGSKAQEWPNLSEEFPDVPQETYTVAPIFDEDPEESHKCWLEQVCLQTKAGKEHIEMVDSLAHVEIRPPKLEGGEVFDSTQECEYQLYAQSIYDEDPREGMGCWPEQELILADLGGSHLHSSTFLQPEVYTSGNLGVQDIQDSPQKNVTPEDNNIPEKESVKVGGIYAALGVQTQPSGGPLQYEETCQGKEIQILIDKGSSLNLVSRELCYGLRLSLQDQDTMESKGSVAQLTKVVSLWKEQIEGSYEEDVLILDPGGSMQSSWSKSAINLVDKQQVSQQAYLPRVTTEELVDKQSEGKEQLSRPMLQHRNDTDLVGSCQRDDQGFMYVLLATEVEVANLEAEVTETTLSSATKSNLEDLLQKHEGREVPRINFPIYIYDPGGNLSYLQGVLLSVSTGITRLHKLLQSFFNRELEDARATMRAWLIFKEGGMSGMALLAL